MVHEREGVGGEGGGEVVCVGGGSVWCAGEVCGVGVVVACFPDEVPFGHEVGVGCACCDVCDEVHETGAVADHLLEGWPGGGGAGQRGGFVGIACDVGIFVDATKVGSRCGIRVDEKNGDNF